MSQNPFGLTGFSHLQGELPDETKRHICEILESIGAVKFSSSISKFLKDEKSKIFLEEPISDASKMRAFLKSLDDSVGIFHAVNNISEHSSKLNEVRARFRKIQNTAMILHTNLADISTGERLFLGEEICTLFDTLKADSIKAAQLLRIPRKAASKFKAGRRPVSYSTLHMAAHVADAMRHDLEIVPTSTKSGLFIELLEVVYEAATGKEPKALHSLAPRALKVGVTRNSDGTIIFDLQKPI